MTLDLGTEAWRAVQGRRLAPARVRPRRRQEHPGHGGKGPDDRCLEPLSVDRYDYAGHVLWQWHAFELWRRFTMALDLAHRANSDVDDFHRNLACAGVPTMSTTPAMRQDCPQAP